MSKWPIRWDLLFRYRMIEVIALWEGRLTTNHLIKSFGIGRQQASKDINTYLTDVAPGNLVYDKQLKGYKPSDCFAPRLTSGHADEYLHILSRSEDMTITFKELDMGFENTTMVRPVTRNIAPEILRPLVQAIREKKRVDISYTSLKDGIEVDRLISPHTLVCTPLRWHVRAYCEYSRGYRDFVLSRIRGIPDINDKMTMGKSQDELWNNEITVELAPDSRFTTNQAAVISNDYGMNENMLQIPTNAALVRYVLDAYNIDINMLNSNPKGQQIILNNFEELKPYLLF
ncbi:putative DNA-binding transcriptional regulator YafY [Vibrio crassostreae]|uniref:helix-turn-helix transcriptional regulator n=1 Tax=Vibrio crassostreae TaxID=246167 RepID=UPI000F48B3C3|nr:WYL domain-containing protein [Vibrio crassostreae]ROR15995.1 putative DNA-binding transcriptional regulator YafY [Vibrio crassostreae]CAK2075289.1 putative DNA-binding transcriptional regulator YafY [Vibrio crassostreae]CAK2344162.1 putative DNA-binding transcriptional regulator YafY [Vibrio crassostreae]CAK2355623.1 putative DNA-binding transcriptional regulator YafY [Vibrio crassostreae]CAK3412196.1 putative DNA-binding transcriptional regulator YafY [Vibrio crassostreae]